MISEADGHNLHLPPPPAAAVRLAMREVLLPKLGHLVREHSQ
jgi:hypothetical protein